MNAALLVSLGTSPAIVPEAFLLPGSDFDAVHVLTTASVKEEAVRFVIDWFRDTAPDAALTITRVAGFEDFKSEDDHFRFEEVLYRWWLEKAGEVPPHVCLAGGFKTMSSAMQKAAAVLGAADVFHVLCDLPPAQQPSTAVEIDAAKAGGRLHWIRLGEESGWPQFRRDRAGDYLLVTEREEGAVRWVSAPDQAFRLRLREIVERSHRIAGAWDRMGSLPFPVLATWPGADLGWLGEPVSPEADKAWVTALPKVELHCHLGGFATHGELLSQVRAAAENPANLPVDAPPGLPPGWPLPARPIPLPEYMKLGDANGSALLSDPGCLRRQCELLYAHLREQNVVYAEIRCSPANYAVPGRSPWAVLEEIKRAFDACKESNRRLESADPPSRRHSATPFVNLIVIATRKETGDYRAAISRHLALAVSAAEHWTAKDECRVVGVDLAGYEEEKTRAHYFRDEFTGVHRCGLALTVHAGENDDAEGIWRAVFDLNARRLGHALHLIDSPELLGSVADRGIGVEMCPYANLQIKDFPLEPAADSPTSYPLKRYLDAGIKVTVNTDNIGISAASLTDNLLLAARLCPGLTRMDLLWLQAHALQTAFMPSAQRERVTAALSLLLPSPF